MTDHALHPVTALFPAMPDDEYRALVEDVRTQGVLVPVIVDDEDRIIDGRHRWRAAQDAGVPCPVVRWDGTDAWLAAQSANLTRRHLTKEQVVAIRLLAAERHPELAAPLEGARDEAKERQAEAGRSHGRGIALGRMAQSYERVRATDRIGEQVGASGRTVRRVERAARTDPQALELIAAGEKTSRDVVREQRTAEKRERSSALAALEVAPALDAYPVLCADPPWRYESNTTPDTRSIENHYPTMTAGELAALDVPAAPDSVMFLWATSPKLAEAMALLAAWEFDYRTCMVWVKDRIGMGHYVRQQHELLLIAKRGGLHVPDAEDRPSSVIHAPRLEHSRKPDEAYALIERMYPDLPRVEMFARGGRARWAVWGNEAAQAAA